MTTSPKTWLPTKDKWLYRHQSGTYYARLPIRGKETWRSLRTQTLSVARTKLEELRKDVAHLQEHATGADDPTKLTGAQIIALRLAELDSDASIKESTRHYWKQIFAALVRTWPEFPDLEIRRITAEQCQAWTRSNKDRLSPTRFNNTLGGLRTLFALAIKKGARRSNPAAELRRMPVRSKDLSSLLPTRQQFLALVNAIRTGGGRFSKASADLVEFLAYTGVRLSEARWIQWRHCDFTRGEIVVAGDPVHATKNGEIRRIPMTQACRALLERIKSDRGEEPATESVMRVYEAQKSLDRGLEALSLPRFTHHDLRHYFATICIESGVDIPTFSKWLGHKDGGALAMKVYGHLRNEHSLAAASRVSFAV